MMTDLDDIRELLYAYTKQLTTLIEEGGIEQLYEPLTLEEIVDTFLDEQDLTGYAEKEGSY